jgi:hypothetical protein
MTDQTVSDTRTPLAPAGGPGDPCPDRNGDPRHCGIRRPVERRCRPAATAQFHDRTAADNAGYSALVADLAGITCIASPTASDGAMGVHYLNPTLVPELFDPTAAAEVDAATPELLVYAPGPDGQLRLVALEYLTIKASWDAQHPAPPTLFGQPFNTTAAGNRYGLPGLLQPACLDLGSEPDRPVRTV